MSDQGAGKPFAKPAEEFGPRMLLTGPVWAPNFLALLFHEMVLAR